MLSPPPLRAVVECATALIVDDLAIFRDASNIVDEGLLRGPFGLQARELLLERRNIRIEACHAICVVVSQIAVADERGSLCLARNDGNTRVLDQGRRRALADRHPGRGCIQEADSLVRQLQRRVSAGSFSIYWRYSAQVVAAMVRNVPRARGGLRRLAASPVPAEPPAPIRVWASSMNKMMGVGELCTSSITERSRCSNSPFIDAPACIRPMSSAQSRTFFSGGGTSPDAIRWAKPSTTAVLPTPASPVRIGLFCRRRIRTSINWRISSSRPRIGSISPEDRKSTRLNSSHDQISYA